VKAGFRTCQKKKTVS